eukprot:g8780.t1
MKGARFDLWISNRYRTLVQPLVPNGVPPTDNLYINVNDLLLQRFRWDEYEVRSSEESILSLVGKYLEFLVQTVKPKQYLFIAVDGSAPAAFLHSERTEKILNKWKSQNPESLKRISTESNSEPFNPNHFTPGTKFMTKLEKHILFFIRHQMSSCSSWQTPKVIYSGSNLPGDAHTKIFEFVRFLRDDRSSSQQNMTHCIYSIQTDTVLNILALKERFFYILRDKTSIDNNVEDLQCEDDPKADNFITQHMSLFWDYWALEWKTLAHFVDLDCTVNDLLFLCLLFGNKALPGIPTIHLMEGSLDTLIECYKDFLQSSPSQSNPSSDNTSSSSVQYLINEDRSINASNLEAFLRIAASDSKEIKRLQNRVNLKKENISSAAQCLIDDEAAAIIERSEEPYIQWKNWYYVTKWKFDQEDLLGRKVAATCYMQGLIWSFHHLMKGIICWNFCYPHDYAPCLSDLVETCSNHTNVFDANSKPLTLMEHMLCVLPAMESALVPTSHQLIMTSNQTPFRRYFDSTATTLPVGFDREGAWSKREVKCLTDWINVRNIRATIGTFVKEQLFVWPDLKTHLNSGYQQIFLYKQGFKESSHCKSTLSKEYDDVEVPNSAMVSSLPFPASNFVPNNKKCFQIEEVPEGFPQLTHAHYCSSLLTSTGVDRYGQVTQQSSLILGVAGGSKIFAGGARMVFERLQGKQVLVGFPYHICAIVVGASDAWVSLSSDESTRIDFFEDPDLRVSEYKRVCGDIWKTMWVEYGINIRNCGIILHLLSIENDSTPTLHPLQFVQIALPDGNYVSVDEYLSSGTAPPSSMNLEQSVGAPAEISNTETSECIEQDLISQTPLNLENNHNGLTYDVHNVEVLEPVVCVFEDYIEGQTHMEFESNKEEQDEEVQYEDEYLEPQQTNLSHYNEDHHEIVEHEIHEQDEFNYTIDALANVDVPLPTGSNDERQSKRSMPQFSLAEATEKGYVSALEFASYSEVSEESMLYLLTSCVFKTIEGEKIDVGLGLDIKGSLQSIWFSPELIGVIEDQLAFGCWAYRFVSAHCPSNDGTFDLESSFPEIKQQRRIIGSMRGFLEAIDQDDLVFMDILEGITAEQIYQQGGEMESIEDINYEHDIYQTEGSILQFDDTIFEDSSFSYAQQMDVSTVSPGQTTNVKFPPFDDTHVGQ